MSTQLSNENRQLVNRALISNYNALVFWGRNTLPTPVLDTVLEMARLTIWPYDPANVDYVGDTLDRHSWSCVGNLCEVVTVMTIARPLNDFAVNCTQILRSIEDQVSTKADLCIGHSTYQVKTATYGSGGQLFIAEAELEGTADYMAYVDSCNRNVIRFKRSEFRKNMKTIMDIGGPYDRWFNKAGWFITPSLCEFVDVLPIPVGVTTAYYNADEQQIYLSNGT